MLRAAGLVWITLLAAGVSTAQVAPPGAADPVIRVNVELRQVDVTVTDAQGKHVLNLEPSDFQLFEDGKPQPITNLSWVEVTPPPSGRRAELLKEKPSLLEWYTGVARIHRTPGNDILSAPVANPKKGEIRRVISIVAGDSRVPAMQRIRKFIDEQIGPGDMVSIRNTLRTVIPVGASSSNTMQIRDSAGIFQQFTNDKRQLDAATERLPRICSMEHLCINDPPGTLTAAIRSLQGLPGRKALLFVGRYKGPIGDIVTQADRAGVVIYVLDDVGVLSEGETVSEMVAPDSERLLAEKTGGRLLLSTVGFDLTTGFNEVVEDLSGYYLLGYRPPDESAQRLRHRISVKLLRPGLTARFRDGIIGGPDVASAPDPLAERYAVQYGNPAPQTEPELQPSPAGPPARQEILTNALFSIFTRDGIRIRLNPLFAASSADPKKKRHPVARAILDIDGRDLDFMDAEGGKKRTVLDVALAVFNEDGSQAGAANKAFTVVMSQEKAAEIGRTTLQYPLDVPLTKPGAYQVRAAVRDQNSGGIGSAYAFLDIPDFNRSDISLSSLVLSLPQGATANPPARSAWNEFAPGSTVTYACEVFGLKTPGKPPATPDVATEVKLYRGGGPVADIPTTPVKVESVAEQSFLSGGLRLPEGLAAGNYSLEVLAYDQHEPSKKRRVARQWVDVTVVNPRN